MQDMKSRKPERWIYESRYTNVKQTAAATTIETITLTSHSGAPPGFLHSNKSTQLDHILKSCWTYHTYFDYLSASYHLIKESRHLASIENSFIKKEKKSTASTSMIPQWRFKMQERPRDSNQASYSYTT